MTPRTIRHRLRRIKALVRGAATSLEEIADGEEPVATPPPGATPEWERETSTNAQTSAAATQPWSGNR